jgi:hypothetical protein
MLSISYNFFSLLLLVLLPAAAAALKFPGLGERDSVRLRLRRRLQNRQGEFLGGATNQTGQQHAAPAISSLVFFSH